MSDELHVLVYGGTEIGVCAFYRFEMYREALARLGVIVRPFVKARMAFDEAFGETALERAGRAGLARNAAVVLENTRAQGAAECPAA